MINIFDFIPLSTLNHFKDDSIILFDKMDGYWLVRYMTNRPKLPIMIRVEACGSNGNVSTTDYVYKEYSLKDFLDLGPHKIKQKMPIYF